MVHLSMNPGECNTLLEAMNVVVSQSRIMCMDRKKCRLFLDKNNLCEVMEVCPVLYILSLSCLDK